MAAPTFAEMAETEKYWLEHGLGAKAAGALARSKINSLEQLKQIGPQGWRAFFGIGRKTWNEVRYLAEWPEASGIEVRYAYDKELANELRLRGWKCVPPGDRT